MRGLPKVFVGKDVGKSIIYWFCFTSFRDWSRKLAPLSPPIRFKTETNCDLVARVFPRFRQFACFALSFHWLFEIFLLAMISLCDCVGFG